MFYHVKLSLSPNAQKHFGCENIMAFDIPERSSIVKNVIEPINKNVKFNYAGYRNINPDDITYMKIVESEGNSDAWAKNKQREVPPNVIMIVTPEWIFQSSGVKDITDELCNS